MLDKEKRIQNEKKFGKWDDLPDGGRRYYFNVIGRVVGSARYVKIVDGEEKTLSFGQEIYDAFGNLIEIHQKYPNDTGHKKV